MTRSTSERAAIAAIALLFIVPLLYPPIPPLGDVPGHIGRFMLAADIGSDPFLAKFYSYQWRPIGNLGVDLPVALLAPLIGVESAAKWVIAAIPPVMSTALLLTYRRLHGRLAAPAFLATCFVFSMPFNAGFVNFWIGMAVGWLVVWVSESLDSSEWRATVLLFAGALTWSMHVLAWLLVAAILAGLELGRPKKLSWDAVRSLIRRLWPFVAVPVFMQSYWMLVYGTSGVNAGWFEIRDKISAIIRSIQFQDRHLSLALLAAILLVAVASIAQGARLSRGMAWATLFVGAIFVVVPHVLMGSWAADQRIAPVIFMTALIAIAPRRPIAIIEATAAALMAATVGLATFAYAGVSDRLTTFLTIGKAVPSHSRLIYFYVQDCDPYKEKSDPRQHAASLFIGRNHVFTGQWNVGGASLMTVHYPAAGDFQGVGRTMVRPDQCANRSLPSLNKTLNDLPASAFDYVIIDHGGVIGVTPVMSAGGANLYTVTSLKARPNVATTSTLPATRHGN